MPADGIAGRPAYNYRNCQSLFGYAARVHARSGATCQLCNFGAGRIDFDSWRQLTVEHVIGESQGGYPRAISEAVASRFPQLSAERLAELAQQIDVANTVSACQFCNSTTSRNRAVTSMYQLIADAPDDPDLLVTHVTPELQSILEAKRTDVAWKIAAVREAFDRLVSPGLEEVRRDSSSTGRESSRMEG